ncbi:MAG: FAD-binding oxidoreductase [Promethearchaeota archaeon]
MSKIENVYGEIEKVIGPDYITDKDFMKAAYSRNVDPSFPDRWADMIVRPETVEEVSEIVKIANKYKIHMVPRGGGADLVGGSVTEGGILIDLTRMNNILEVNEDDYYIIVECGVTWGALLSELHPRGYTTGVIGPGSGFAATIGGGLSNSTAGGGSTKYGLVPDICLGVEVVLPDLQGTIIKTGAAANRYAAPFCRYGIAPDFTGLFMGDVGTMGIKTKAYMRIFPDPPYKAQRSYILLKNNYDQVFELAHKLRNELGDGLVNLSVLPLMVIQLLASRVEVKPAKRPKLRGPAFGIMVEATDPRILDIYLEKIDKIMTKDEISRKFEWGEVDPSLISPEEWSYDLKQTFNYFQRYISVAPPKVSCTTCHKIPISNLPHIPQKAQQFDSEHRGEFPPGAMSFWSTIVYFLPNGNCVLVGGFNADNIDDVRDISMNLWHKKLRSQVRYGGVHYWLGESISQSILEADAYTPEFVQFFRDMKKSVDPNFLLSPNKFHMYSYDYDYTKHIVKDEE